MAKKCRRKYRKNEKAIERLDRAFFEQYPNAFVGLIRKPVYGEFSGEDSGILATMVLSLNGAITRHALNYMDYWRIAYNPGKVH
jgi:hypothetical protein